MPNQVCMGAMMTCTMGMAPSSLVVLPINRVMTNEVPDANIMDHVPLVNIMPFGMCMSPANPVVAAATAIGCKRSNNDDSFGYDAGLHIYVVCDGMGGNAAGEVASGMAVRTLIETYGYFSQDIEPGSPMEMVENRLLASIFEANRVVREAGLENPELHSRGTT